MAQEKISCYEKNDQNPEAYYSCIDNVEKKMRENSSLLQQRFGQVDVIYSQK